MLILATSLLSRIRSVDGTTINRRRRPNFVRRGRFLPAATPSLRRDHAFLEDEATIEATFAGGNNGEGALGALVEGEAFDAKKRHVLARSAIDGLLHFTLHRRHGVRIADDLHAASGSRQQRNQRPHRQDTISPTR